MTPRTCATCRATITRHSKTGLCVACANEAKRVRPVDIPPSEGVAADRAARKEKTEGASLKKRYDEALKTIETLEQALAVKDTLENVRPEFTIEPRQATKTGEATVVAVASDWHIEELVGAEVGTLNRYTPEIAEARARTFFQGTLRLTRLLQQDITIQQMVLALLGDFITNDIHDAENAETNALLPMHAIARAEGFVIAGIEMLLRETALTFVIPCHSGNHARTTHKTRFGTENGHSLEWLMYRHLAQYFRNEPRITFLIPEGMHSYVTVYDQVIRFHHGHAIKYGGGVGGIYIPTNKAISQWSKARRADLDVFGHFHQLRDGGNFICNGSMIGYNSFALSIKADYERPKQALFLIDKKRGRTCTWPILFDN